MCAIKHYGPCLDRGPCFANGSPASLCSCSCIFAASHDLGAMAAEPIPLQHATLRNALYIMAVSSQPRL